VQPDDVSQGVAGPGHVVIFSGMRRQVSALQFLRVHKVFREMVENIILQPQLWSSDSLKEFYQKHKQQTILQDQCVLS